MVTQELQEMMAVEETGVREEGREKKALLGLLEKWETEVHWDLLALMDYLEMLESLGDWVHLDQLE
jgi:hypothetical protein